MKVVALIAAAFVASGCFAVADLDRFEQREVGLVVDLDGFEEFAGQRVELRLYRSDLERRVEARAVIEDMPASHSFVLPFGLDTDERFFDVYVDADGDRQFTATAGATDPSWRRPLSAEGHFSFVPDEAEMSLADPPTMSPGQDFVLEITGFDPPHTGGTQALELLVVDRSTGLPVGYYYLPDINTGEVTVHIPGIIEPDRVYQVAFFADKTQDGAYNFSEGGTEDHSWTQDYEGTATGIQATFPHNALFVDVSDFFPEP